MVPELIPTDRRREQDQDCQVRCFGPLDPAGKVKGYACAEERYRGSVEHDA